LAGGTGAVYFTLTNAGKTPVKLIGGDTPAAASVEFHITENDNGVMKMRQITGGIEIAPGKSIELAPGAMHMMLVNLKAPLAEGDTIKVTLHFDGAKDLTIDVPVIKIGSAMSDGM
jgi:copper(I)-binding protein